MNTKGSRRRVQDLIEQVAQADARGRAVPLFVSRALNLACIRRADEIRAGWRFRKYRLKKEALLGSD